MPLEMKTICEKCDATIGHGDECVICSYECTFCKECGEKMKHLCPNCGGELVPRPKRLIT